MQTSVSTHQEKGKGKERGMLGGDGGSCNLDRGPCFLGTFVVVIGVAVVKATARGEAAGCQSNSCSFAVTSGDKSVRLCANRTEGWRKRQGEIEIERTEKREEVMD